MLRVIARGWRLGVAAGAVALAVAPPALGAAEIGPDRIVVASGGAGAVIERAPVRISFRGASGRTVLRQLDRRRLPGAGGTVDAPPGGFQIAPDVAAYAPLAFEVGGERGLQHPGGLWTGNMIANGRAGAVHFPTRVLDAERQGEGVRMTLATTDPSRRMQLRVLPDRGRSLRVLASVGGAGVASIGDAFETGSDESFHGFGGRHNATDQRGNDFYNWIEEEAFNSGPLRYPVESAPGSGGDRYLFPNGPTQAYYVQNLFLSSRPYGFLLNRARLTRWRMASGRPDAWQVTAHGSSLDYTVALGRHEAIRSLTAINGRHRVPPDWALGPMLKRNVQQGTDDPESQQEKIKRDIDEIERRRLPVTGYSYESWDTLPESFVRATNRRLKALGIHPIGYVRAYVNNDGNFDPPGTFEEAVAGGYVAKTPGGAPWVSVAVGPAALLDFTNPATVEWWAGRKIRPMLDLGFDGFMQDFGEQALTDMRFHNGETGATMHNRYPIVFHRATRRIVNEYERQNPEREPVWMYTRAGFSGRHGSAAFESSNFPGDESTDWSRSNGIAFLASDMLNRGLGGAYGYSTDIGGYFDNFTQAGPLSKELFIRWSQWAALSPHFRLHNSCCAAGTRMPWSFDAEALAVWTGMARLHQRSRVLRRRLWKGAQRTGLPVARPLWVHYPDDAEARRQDQQWLLGRDVLVAPVVEQGARQRRVYFPRGCWRDPETGKRYRGARYVTVSAPLRKLPYFIRCGKAPFALATRVRVRLALRCRARGVRAVVGGSGVGRVRRVRFYVAGRRVGSDARRPFARTIPRRHFERRRAWRVRAVAQLRDGRRSNLRAVRRPCASRGRAPQFTGKADR